MKKAILFSLVLGSFSADAQQSLKDLLYSGKLKRELGVIRKTDDLSMKIDNNPKKTVEIEQPKAPVATVEANTQTAQKVENANANNTVANTSTTEATNPVTTATSEETTTVVEPVAEAKPAAVKTNTKILKEYGEALVSALQAEVLNSKKIKKETYFVTVDYEISPEGAVTIGNVVSTPENVIIVQQVKDRMELNPPKLSPAVDGSGKPYKVKRKYNFSVTKD